MMSYGAKPGMASVLIPDHTHWGNEGGLLARLSDGRGISGWDAQYQYLKVAAPPQNQLFERVVFQRTRCRACFERHMAAFCDATLVPHQPACAGCPTCTYRAQACCRI